MASRIAQLLGFLRTGSKSNATAAVARGTFSSVYPQAPSGANISKLAAAHFLGSSFSRSLHTNATPIPTFDTAHVGAFVRQLLQRASGPITARHVSSSAQQSSARSFGTLVRSAVSDGKLSLARRPDVLRKADKGAFSCQAGGKRSQYTDGRGVTHFRARGFQGAYQDPNRRRRLLIIVGVAGGGLYIYYVTHLEEVPYTHRKHFIAISPATERALGEQQFQQIKLQFADDILPNNHPETRRVRKIASRIIDAATAGVDEPPQNKRDADGELVLDTAVVVDKEDQPKRRELKPGKRPVPIPGEDHMHGGAETAGKRDPRDEELQGVDREMLEEGVHGAPDKGGGGGYTDHLKGLRWEVLVVDKDILNAFCLPGGKIVVFTGLIKHFPTSDEIATVLGHEVAHGSARHVGEKLSSGFIVSVLELAAYFAGLPIELIVPASQSLISLPNSRKLESEADKIGLILMAAAGYDPRIAPSFYAKMAQLEGLPEYFQYLSTHPAGQQRARALAQSKVMEEAVRIYERTLEKQQQHKFFLGF
ncbi:Peptidase family M48 family protein [Klebsormidium nitens]|uniref:Peptidase family M48 family protein n=1 Tax=Klebsormidium nitens TaxID=105231 RepID=A0A1Y1IKJ3_KLENI|nr:Peptidase family M48 family protein [Klebsormidium nitens]|eukprot:GAQ89671.1 Peptidase family M48 family protein [Klebsormidium nitens]